MNKEWENIFNIITKTIQGRKSFIKEAGIRGLPYGKHELQPVPYFVDKI